MTEEAAVTRARTATARRTSAGSRSTGPPPRRSTAGGPLAALRRPFGLPWSLWRRRLSFRLMQPYYASALYRWRLAGPAPAQLACQPGDPWPGQAALGRAILQGRFAFAGQAIADPQPLWAPRDAGAAWLAELHGFAWLRDLRVLGGDAARRRARELVGAWIDAHPGPGGPAWAPATAGRRLASWLGQYEFYAGSADVGFKAKLLDSAARQARHLHNVLPADLCGADLIAAAKGLLLAGACLPDGAVWRARALALLEAELPEQVQVDGGHVERSPSVHLRVLRDLIDVRGALAAAELEPPRSLQLAIEGMAPFLKLLQHSDGGLALFNDSVEETAVQLDMTLQRAQARVRAQQAAPQSGFQRLSAGRTLVIVDAGAPPPAGYDGHAHAGTLAFEMSHGRQRVIVNCGAHPGHPDWRAVQRATAAHSTLTLAETNSSEIRLPRGGRAPRLGRRPETVVCRREEAGGAVWLDMTHDGYRKVLDALIERRLFLAADGEDLRGEELVNGPAGLPFAIRFHLHPQVSAGLVQHGQAVLLRLAQGVGWRLRVSGAAIALEDGVYLGDPDTVRRSTQIVLSGTTKDGRTTVKWALKRESAKR
jgi:uncharacterized heparinase superfamily protein